MHWLCPKCRAGFDERRERCPADSTRLIENLSGRVFAGRWNVERLLGVGGGGATVWGATGTETRRPVALKLAPVTDVAEVRRFERGARISGMLDHPHITHVIEHGRDAEHAVLVMEVLEGETLKRRVARARSISPSEAVHIADQVLDALDYAHFHGIVHRDIKLSNLFVTPTADDSLFIKILDWGIAKFVSGSEPQGLDPLEGGSSEDGLAVTQAQQILGTPEYMAPEQIVGGAADVRSDLYAVGIVLYRLLAGHHPFEAKTRAEMYHSHLMKEVPPLPSNIAPGLNAVVQRALAKRPEDRWATAGAMRRALQAVMQVPAPDLGSSQARLATMPELTTTERAPTGTMPRPAGAQQQRKRLLIGAIGAAAALAIILAIALPGSSDEVAAPQLAGGAASTVATEKAPSKPENVAVSAPTPSPAATPTPAPETRAPEPVVAAAPAPSAPDVVDAGTSAAAPAADAAAETARKEAAAKRPIKVEPDVTTPEVTAKSEPALVKPAVSTAAPVYNPAMVKEAGPAQPTPPPVSSAPQPEVAKAPAPAEPDITRAIQVSNTVPAPAPTPAPASTPAPKPTVTDAEPVVAPRDPQPPAPTGNEVIPFGAGMNRPVRIAGVEPKYTREALEVGVEGVMIVRCVIETNGALSGCKVLKSLEHMEQAVLGALATHRYSPVMFEGRARRVSYVFNFRFVVPR